MNEKSLKKDENRNSITNYEGKLKIVCHLHINDFNIYEYCFWMPSLTMEKTKFGNFGIISSSNIRALKEEREKYNLCIAP